ncbi:MAG: FISUMP domain-containing protein [Bacteroidota bacterium]|nr:FISUMP domain-containing protein [Bacteroidota bacterium]
MFKTKTVKKNIGFVWLAMLMLILGFLQPSCELITPNKPPFAEISLPEGNIVLDKGEVVKLVINAYDVDGQVVDVQFSIGELLLFSDQTDPFEFSFNSESFDVGIHTISIKAIDDDDTFYIITADIEILATGIISAGDDVTLTDGDTSYVLDGQMTTGGSGVWTTVPEGLGSFLNVTSPNAVFTGTLCESYQLRWTVTNGSQVGYDDVSVTFTHVASDAVAGDDKHYSDGRTSVTLNATEPDDGQGRWTIFGGIGGILLDPLNPKTPFSGKPCEDYFLIWSVSTACETKTDTIFIRLDQVVVQANAGPNQSFIDGTTSTTLQGNDPGLFTAEWAIVSGSGGRLGDPSDPNSGFTGAICETYVLRYRITSGCGLSEDRVSITFNHSPSTANAGGDLIFDDGRTETFLSASDPVIGEGVWTIDSGIGGLIDDPTDSSSRFIGQACGTYVLRWTVSASCGSNSDDVVVTFGHKPTEASAGADQFVTSGDVVTVLAGNTPVEGQGTWTIIEGTGGSFYDTHDPTSQFSGQLCGSYILQWTIVTGCSESFDQVKIEFDKVDIIAFAGPDISYMDGTISAQLQANDPMNATGTWEILSGANGTLTDVNDPGAVFTGLLGRVYVLKWSITSACGSSTDEMKIAFLSTGSYQDTRDGENYPTVLIGDQEWMTKNLNFKTVNFSWPYSNLQSFRDEYGMLYNYEAANVACPDGWHLPSDTEWRVLEKALGMSSGVSLSFGYRGANEGAELKESGLGHWHSPNNNAVDLIGLKALPGGYRDSDGNFGLLGTMGAFWTATQDIADQIAIYRGLHKDKSQIGRDWFDNQNAISVRCVKD